ncbi:1,4-alpha-glucan branching enzyme [Methylocella silvestris BL2]|uniref:1,4-alpha-glucan branching enzyme GlgB n=1 Tax=Methylocella silvestris (strain DSM 15510 / CIP 108128 / LMG 27833 / NCIMB 13906 / BL2) TaxID=395965 RepID=B8EN61_METSB|nr:1,4-alpha-glucan branching protein GlgB [Methylocella silvestris]ACK49196.1 1,4-alpha-glucan branching enzyme [Methylocella silvestris BL2]
MGQNAGAPERDAGDWRLGEDDIAAIGEARHGDPFAVLGPHETSDGLVIRAFSPDADTLAAATADDGYFKLESRGGGVFEGLAPGASRPLRYELEAANAGGSWRFVDPYSIGPVLGQMDDYLLVEGTHRALYEKLGAHLMEVEGVAGVHFAVWAPNAVRVSVVGDFNRWDGRLHQMRKRIDSGLWEIFAPHVGAGTAYKYEIIAHDGRLLPLKADPVGFAGEMRPSTASIVARIDDFKWTDEAFLERRRTRQAWREPMTTLEVHLGSWRRGEGGRFLTYDEFADQLIPYALDLGFTHLELMPVSEHPLDASWGYQPIGLFAPTRRFGDPAAFARFVDRAHAAGLSIILDWVPAHFPTDMHGLAEFDGAPLYEHADPRRGFHPDWNTAIYDFGRREVSAFLIANALFWLDRYHIDGLRVDAVASMLYLDYSRNPGEWLPNEDGGNDNRDAVAFLKRFNELVYEAHPGVVTLAEESTSWPGVSAPTASGGLGFGFKWNMGFMHDTLEYMEIDPIYRRWSHDKLTFGLVYAFSENFVLPLSHDEVTHGKGSLLEKMSGDDWRMFATLRAYYGFMWGHPGKKLLFMGQEFAQRQEWREFRELDWHLLDSPAHKGVQSLIRDLNSLVKDTPALYRRDKDPAGFSWVIGDDFDHSVFAFLRYGDDGDQPVAIVSNFTPEPRYNYTIGLPRGGLWREAINTDSSAYWGSGVGNFGAILARDEPSHGQPASAQITLPPLATLFFIPNI